MKSGDDPFFYFFFLRRKKKNKELTIKKLQHKFFFVLPFDREEEREGEKEFDFIPPVLSHVPSLRCDEFRDEVLTSHGSSSTYYQWKSKTQGGKGYLQSNLFVVCKTLKKKKTDIRTFCNIIILPL